MKKMNIAGDAGIVEKVSPFDRLLLVMDKAYTQGVNNCMPTAWLYDLSIAFVAMRLVRKEVYKLGPDSSEADQLISQLEKIDFCIFGDISRDIDRSTSAAKKTKFVQEVVKPVFNAYMKDDELHALIPDAENLIRYIIEQWPQVEASYRYVSTMDLNS